MTHADTHADDDTREDEHATTNDGGTKMTAEDIDKLKPGTAMDDLIVQHVFGKNPLEARVGVDPKDPYRLQWHWGYPAGHDFAPRFSTDIGAAWELRAHVMDAIPDTAQFQLFQIAPGSGDADGWECCIGEFWDDADRPVGSGDTAPEAICKAALKRAILGTAAEARP